MENNAKLVYFADGTHLIVQDGITWEYENDPNWLKTENYHHMTELNHSLDDFMSLIEQLPFIITPKLRVEFEAIIRETDVPSDGDFWLALMQTVHTNQQKIIDGLSGIIESQKQTMEAMGKRLLMIEQVISGSSNPLTIRIGNILNPTAESAFNQPRFYTEADMLAMGEAVKGEILKSIDAEEVYTKPKSQNAEPVFLGCQIDPESIPDINITQILKTINDGKQQ